MTTHELPPLLQRVQDEADLCRNDGADDIARLLDEVAAALQAQPAVPAFTSEQIEAKLTSYFAEEWAIDNARMLLDECGIRPGAATPTAPAASDAQVGCEGEDGLLRIHKESETCDVCAPSPAPAPDVLTKALTICRDTLPHIGGNERSVHSLLQTIDAALSARQADSTGGAK